MFERSTKLGNINISNEVIATIVGGAVTECYGVVGMASQKMLKDGLYELLKLENYSRGVLVTDKDTGIMIDVYIIVGYGMKISEIVFEVQKKVKYMMEKSLELDFNVINVYVQGVKAMK